MPASPQPRIVSDLTESQLLDRLLPLMDTGPAERVGPGDDAAVLDLAGPVVATTDVVVRGVDWREDWSEPEDLAVKVVTQNLADIAAMGARPRSLLLTLTMEPTTEVEWVLRLAAQLGQECRRYGVSAAGGDLSGAPPGFASIGVTALGVLDGVSPVLRSGARTGDRVAVAGSLGRSAVGLSLLLAATAGSRGVGDVAAVPREALAHHRRPSSPLSQGPIAARAGASAMIDISDGLLRDAGRIGRASGVAVSIDSAALAPDLNWAERYLSREEARACVLTGGEEHSLLACFPATVEVPPWWRVIGEVVDGEGLLLDGRAVPAGGWDHFADRPGA